MSKITLSPNVSGAGVFTITAPATSIDRVLTLPDKAGTIATTVDAVGMTQTWQDLTASRVIGTTYTNSTGSPISVAIDYYNSTATGYSVFRINGITILTLQSSIVNGAVPLSIIIPPGATYGVISISGNPSISRWFELR